jgi:hypothetical protein
VEVFWGVRVVVILGQSVQEVVGRQRVVREGVGRGVTGVEGVVERG